MPITTIVCGMLMNYSEGGDTVWAFKCWEGGTWLVGQNVTGGTHDRVGSPHGPFHPDTNTGCEITSRDITYPSQEDVRSLQAKRLV